MRRPYTQDSEGLARYWQDQRRRQERDEREHHYPEENPEQLPPYSYTRVTAAGVNVDTTTVALADVWVVQFQRFQQVEPIALEAGRQLVMGESGVYVVTFDIVVEMHTPADPDEVWKLDADVSTDLWRIRDDRQVDSLGDEQTISCSLSDVMPVKMADEVQASFLVTPQRDSGAVEYDYQATLSVAWYTHTDVPAPSSS